MLSSVGNISSLYDPTTSAQAQSKVVDKLFEKADTNQDGKITKDELTKSVETDSASAGGSDRKISVDEVFQMLDAGGKGYITKQDAAEGLDKLAQKATEAAEKPAGGGGGGRAGGGTAASASATEYDPRDTNQDGTVSAQEQMAYELKQYTQASTVESSTGASTTTAYL